MCLRVRVNNYYVRNKTLSWNCLLCVLVVFILLIYLERRDQLVICSLWKKQQRD